MVSSMCCMRELITPPSALRRATRSCHSHKQTPFTHTYKQLLHCTCPSQPRVMAIKGMGSYLLQKALALHPLTCTVKTTSLSAAGSSARSLYPQCRSRSSSSSTSRSPKLSTSSLVHVSPHTQTHTHARTHAHERTRWR